MEELQGFVRGDEELCWLFRIKRPVSYSEFSVDVQSKTGRWAHSQGVPHSQQSAVVVGKQDEVKKERREATKFHTVTSLRPKGVMSEGSTGCDGWEAGRAVGA